MHLLKNCSSQQLEPRVESSRHLCSAKKPQNICLFRLIIKMCSMLKIRLSHRHKVTVSNKSDVSYSVIECASESDLESKFVGKC